MRPTVLTFTALWLVAGCRGEIGETIGHDEAGAQPLRCDTPQPGPSPMRRLSAVEYRYTLIDLLGPVVQGIEPLVGEATADLPTDVESLGYHNNASFLSISTPLAHAYTSVAERLAGAAVADLGKLVACDAQARGAAACASELITSFGRRAFRRPLTSEETQRYQTLATSVLGGGTYAEAAEMIVFAMLQSPTFLHRVELDTSEAVRRVEGYELASRLSYALWHSMPDETLLAAAAAGRLSTREEARAQAERMLADPKATRVFHFFEEWLDLDRVPAMRRDAAVFPGLPANLGALFVEETRRFVESVIFADGGSLETLLTAPYTYANATLARHYGLVGPTGDAFVRVALDPAQRAGILLQGGPLTAHDHEGNTSIVRRGLKVRTDLLCQIVGAPPDDFEPPPVDPSATARERLAQHRTDPGCASCHSLMDPLGLPLDEFDAVGRHRTRDEQGRPLDVTSTLNHLEGGDIEVQDAVDMIEALAQTEELRACFGTQLFRYGYGRRETRADACSEQQLQEAFTESGYNLETALLALTQTDAFLYRRAEEN